MSVVPLLAGAFPILADHSMGAAALGFAGPPLLVFAGLAALVVRERLSRK